MSVPAATPRIWPEFPHKRGTTVYMYIWRVGKICKRLEKQEGSVLCNLPTLAYFMKDRITVTSV